MNAQGTLEVRSAPVRRIRNPQSAIRNRTWQAIGCAVLLLMLHTPVRACSVCYGDPDSPLTKGALGGVIVLAAVVYTLLMGFVSVGVYWVVRARRVARGAVQPEVDPFAGSPSMHSGS